MKSLILNVPILGWLIKDAIQGHSDAKYYFVFNILCLFAFLIFTFGYPFLICALLIAAAGFLVFLVLFTATDLIENYVKTMKRSFFFRND